MQRVEIVVASRVRLLAEGLEELLRRGKEPPLSVRLICEQPFPETLAPPPDIVICDEFLLAAALHQASLHQGLRVLLVSDTQHLTMHPHKLQEMVEMGLAGVLTCRTGAALLLEAVKVVRSGGLWFDRQTIARSLRGGISSSRRSGEGAVRVTRRESEVLQGVCAGYTNKEIAQHLYLSEQTVKSHCNRLFKKFGVSNRVQLALEASRAPSASAG